MKKMLEKIEKIKNFAGDRVSRLILISIIIGIIWFAVESSFVLVFQGFLVSINLLKKEQVVLPAWYPLGFSSSICILIVFGFLRSFVYLIKSFTAAKMQTAFSSEQRKRFVDYGLSNVSRYSTKSLVSVFTEVITQSGVVVYYSSLLVTTSVAALLFFAFGAKLALYETLLSVSLLIIVLIPLRYFSKNINAHGIGIVNEFERVNELVLGGIRNNFLLVLYNQINKEKNKAFNSINIYESHFHGYALISGLLSALPLFLGIVIIAFVSFFSLRYIQTEPIKLVAFFYVFLRLVQAASEAVQTISYIKLNLPGIKKLFDWYLEYLNYLNREKLEKKKIKINKISKIEIRGISYGYNETSILFKNITMTINEGDVLLIKGESGVGKSSLLSIIVGILNPIEGDVIVNESKSINCSDLSPAVGYVGPEAFLINGSIRANLEFGLESSNLTDEELWDSLKLVELENLIMNLKDKLDFHLHEGGGLSTGQKQRLSIARAILRKPSVLILDEATANLDSLTEERIIQNLSSLFNGIITVVVSHRDCFDKYSTKKIVLKKEA